jgi:hypothetical protein
MKVGEDSDAEDPQIDPTDVAGGEVLAEEKGSEKGEADEDDETVDESRSYAPESSFGANTPSRSVITGGTTLATGLATEKARRLGIDRHAEAGFAERAFAKAYAKKVDGTIVDDGSSVFAPDNGIDKIVYAGSNNIPVQSKHYCHPIENHTIEKYADKVDAIGTTNGVRESADPEQYGLEYLTADDWPWRERANLEIKRIVRGFSRGVNVLSRRARIIIRHLTSGAKSIAQQINRVLKWFYHRLVKFGSATAAWFFRRSLVTQIFLSLTAIVFVYLVWRWYSSED